MKPYLVVDEEVSQERNYERLVKIWGHPELLDTLLPKLNSDKNFFAITSITCQNRVYLEVVLHPLADVNDVTTIKEFVQTSWDEMGEDLLEIEPEQKGDDWVDYKGLDKDRIIDDSAISGLGELFRPTTREQKRLLMTLLFDAARNLYDIGSADIRDEDFLHEEPEPEPIPDEEEAKESESESETE